MNSLQGSTVLPVELESSLLRCAEKSGQQIRTLVVHPGTQHSFHLAQQLQRHGCLSRFWTGFGYVPESKLGRIIECLPAQYERRLSNRRVEGLPTENLRTQAVTDLRAVLRLRMGHDSQTVMFERNAAFQSRIPEEEIAGSDVVIGYDTASWRLGERALAQGRRFILVQTTIGYPARLRQLFSELRHRFPEWADDFPPRLRQLSAGEQSEQRQAHRIIVASSLTKRSLIENGVSAERIVVNPLGVNLDEFSPAPRPVSRPLRFVFLGSLIATKGVPLLLQAWRSLAPKNAELWLAGPDSKRHAQLIPALPGLRMIGQVPHRELAGFLRQCDVLVFPSYFEGFGLVLLEALAAGLPIIATDATAAPDLITDGMEGYIIPAGDAEALRDAMQRFVTSPHDLEVMSQAARRCAERYTWDSYGDRWLQILQQERDANDRGPANSKQGVVSTEVVFERALSSKHTLRALLVHPGTQDSFKLAQQLQRHGCLSRFWTGFGYVPESKLGRLIECLPAQYERRLSNRRVEGLPTENLRTQPVTDLRAVLRLRMGHDSQAVMFERNAAFQSRIPEEEIAGSDVVIGYDTASWRLGERALAQGRRFILVQTTIGYPARLEQLFSELRHRFPEWADDFPPRLRQLSVGEQSEQRQAHRIIVASSLTKRSLIENGVSAERIIVNPLGVNLDEFSPAPCPASRPLRFVFLGSLIATKGVPLLLQAWRSLAPKNAELWLAGPDSKRHAQLIPALPGLRMIGQVPHRELAGFLRQCDVLVFPSYFEGFGLVLLEALAAGLPIIATDATAAPDLITDGMEGYIIPAGDAEALRDAMQRFVTSPHDLEVMSQAARRCAERYTWDSYGDRWLQILRQMV